MSQWIRSSRLVRIICGCLASVGIVLSTVLAQSHTFHEKLALLPNGSESRGRSYPSRRNSGGNDGTNPNVAAIYSRFSSEQQDAKSIEDQVRECRERATQDGFSVSHNNEFADHAVSGTKLRRDGLDQLLDAARSGQFQVLYFHSLSRLARESVISMPMLKELVYVYRIRVISLTEGLDTNRQGWEVNATFSSLHHEQFIKDLSANVHRGQVGTVMARFSIGDYRFGYSSEPSPGGEMIGRGGNMKPRKVYVIVPEEAEWVRQIFNWYVVERRTLSWIIRTLNQMKVPKDHRSSTVTWTRAPVIKILRSPKYIGLWGWGRCKNTRNPSTGTVHQEERPEEETIQWCREFPELRIIEDEIYDAAQKRLNESNETCKSVRGSNGQLHGSTGKHCHGQHLLASMVQCAGCGSKLYVGGSHGNYLFCPGARDGICGCKTQLPRDRAEQYLLKAVGERVLANPTWMEAVYESLKQSWQKNLVARPDNDRNIQKLIDDCDRVIQRLVNSIETSDEPDPAISQRLRERRAERNELVIRQRQMTKPPATLQIEPTREWCVQQMTKLGEVLRTSTPAAVEAFRCLLDGPIVVEEVPVPGRKRRFWRGTFSLRLGRIAAAVVPDLRQEIENLTDDSELLEAVTLDFRAVTKTEQQGDIAWQMAENGLQCQEIAKFLDVSLSRVTMILKEAAVKRGIAGFDGRLREASWSKKNQRPDDVQDEVLRLSKESRPDAEIASKLNLTVKTVRQIISIVGK